MIFKKLFSRKTENVIPDDTYQTKEEADFMFELYKNCGLPVSCRPFHPVLEPELTYYHLSVDWTVYDRATKRIFSKGDIVYNVHNSNLCIIDEFNYTPTYVYSVIITDLVTGITAEVIVDGNCSDFRNNYCLDINQEKKFRKKRRKNPLYGL